jgi:hypothetical protein
MTTRSLIVKIVTTIPCRAVAFTERLLLIVLRDVRNTISIKKARGEPGLAWCANHISAHVVNWCSMRPPIRD